MIMRSLFTWATKPEHHLSRASGRLEPDLELRGALFHFSFFHFLFQQIKFCLSLGLGLLQQQRVHAAIICSLGEEPVKLSIKVPIQRFWLTFKFLLETISGLTIRIPLIRTKISLL